MDNNTGLQVTIPERVGRVPEVHPAATVLTVGWGHEVGVVESATVLSIGNDTIIFLATPTEVVLLEVTRRLVKSITRLCGQLLMSPVEMKNVPVVEIMNHVGGIKQLGDGGVDVLPGLTQSILVGCGFGVVNEVEFEVLSTVRSVIGDVVISTFPVLLGENVVTPGDGGVADRGTVAETFVGRIWIIGNGQGVPTQGAGEFVDTLCFDGSVSFSWVVDAPLEDVVGCGNLVLPGDRGVGIRSPINHRDDLVRRVGGDSSLIPVVLHLNLKLPDEVEVGGVAIGDLYVRKAGLDGVDGLGDIVDEFYGGMGFATNKAAVHMGGHAINVVVVLGKDVLNHMVLGGSGDHKLEERMTRIFQLMAL